MSDGRVRLIEIKYNLLDRIKRLYAWAYYKAHPQEKAEMLRRVQLIQDYMLFTILSDTELERLKDHT